MNPLALLSPILGRIPAVAWLVIVLLAWGTWNRHQARTEQARAAAATEAAQQHAAAAKGERDAREFEHQSAVKAQENADAYAKERTRAAAAAAGARSELDRLRDALAAPAASASAAATGAACGTDGAAELRAMVRSGAEALSAMATACDAEESKLKALQGWVRSTRGGSPSD
jgi:hypothetical protein